MAKTNLFDRWCRDCKRTTTFYEGDTRADSCRWCGSKNLGEPGPIGRSRGEMKRSRTHDAEILGGIPMGVWADLWATEKEEKGHSFGGGVDIVAIAPKPPSWAKKWAKELADKIVALNHKSLEELYEMVERAGFSRGREDFGFLLGMQAVGHGISWSDDVSASKLSHDAIKLPRADFYR